MPVREGGSYAADPKTGEEKLVERTEHPDLVQVANPEPEPDVPTAPAAGEPEAPLQPTGRRGGTSKS